MARFVIDASSTLDWAFDEGSGGDALRRLLATHDLVAPWLWRLEVVHTVMKKERRKLLTEAQGTLLFRAIDSLNVEVAGEPADRSLAGLAAVSRPHQLSAYDAVYLDLAVRRGLPLLTGDQNLKDAATRVGVELVAVPPPG